MARLKQFQALEEHGYDRKEGYRIISCPRGGLEEELDALRDNPSPWVLINANLNQSTLERLVRECGHRLERLILFPSPGIEDLSPLEDLKRLKQLMICWNQRVERLWNLSKNPELQGLRLEDFTRLHHIDGIEAAPSLIYYSFGNAMWATAVLETLEPLLDTKLQEFSFDGKKILRDDITIYPRIPTLRYLSVPAEFYRTEQLAWLTARGLQGWPLTPWVRCGEPSEQEDRKDIRISGKRKPF
ncbi:hypothetical protein M5E87_18580 [Flavonifractor plautii]|nr:hypothetical protein M5E87_18580 [Flavonifractor plautii]